MLLLLYTPFSWRSGHQNMSPNNGWTLSLYPFLKKVISTFVTTGGEFPYLSVAGKVFARLIADRISNTSESIIDETQCGFRKQRGTVDMIFVAHQLQEKAREQSCQLFMCFFDLKKAYDSVPGMHYGACLVNGDSLLKWSTSLNNCILVWRLQYV